MKSLSVSSRGSSCSCVRASGWSRDRIKISNSDSYSSFTRAYTLLRRRSTSTHAPFSTPAPRPSLLKTLIHCVTRGRLSRRHARLFAANPQTPALGNAGCRPTPPRRGPAAAAAAAAAARAGPGAARARSWQSRSPTYNPTARSPSHSRSAPSSAPRPRSSRHMCETRPPRYSTTYNPMAPSSGRIPIRHRPSNTLWSREHTNRSRAHSGHKWCAVHTHTARYWAFAQAQDDSYPPKSRHPARVIAAGRDHLPRVIRRHVVPPVLVAASPTITLRQRRHTARVIAARRDGRPRMARRHSRLPIGALAPAVPLACRRHAARVLPAGGEHRPH